MNLEFLKDFPTRMKKVGTYGLIYYNSMFKNTWKTYGFEEGYEYINIIYAIMLFIMEQSLKDEVCTLDDIASYIDEINTKFFKKPVTYEECKGLGDFVVNTVLCDDGKAMYFKGYDFDDKDYVDINISYVNNRIVYINDAIRRTSYYLTEDGYSLLLGTLEMENNMKLTIYEMIFNLKLEKAEYGEAVNIIKNIFIESRRQLQKIAESIRRIRENVLNFSSEEYLGILNDNMKIIKEHKTKFRSYKNYVDEKIDEFYNQGIELEKLDAHGVENLENLGIINEYLSRVIGEQQKILNTHFDFKRAYSDALTGMTAVASIKRINFKNDILEPVMRDGAKLDALDRIFRPLYLSKPDKAYNINKCVQYQKTIKIKDEEDDEEIALDEQSLKEEKERQRQEKLLKYKGVLEEILDFIMLTQKRTCSLSDIVDGISEGSVDKSRLVPSVEIFREVMIELLKAHILYFEELSNEAQSSIQDDNFVEFEITKIFLAILDENKRFKTIKGFEAEKLFSQDTVKIYDVPKQTGYVKTVICSNIEFRCL